MKPRILWLHRQQSAVGYYRTWVPARYLSKQGYEVFWQEDAPCAKYMTKEYKTDTHVDAQNKWLKERLGKYDLIILDRSIDQTELGLMAGYRHYSPGCRMIVDFDDDFANVPWWNTAHGLYQPGQALHEIGLQHLKLAEMTTVSTKTLADRFGPKAHRIKTIENAIDPKDWAGLQVNPDRAQDPHLYVLYGGAAGHFGDLDEAKTGIMTVIENPPVPFRLICFGAVPHWLHDASRAYPGRVVSLPWAGFEHYPQAVAWGGFDIAIAPLAQHPFNEAKSNIKWQEAAIQKIPFLCSDVGPYHDNVPDGTAIRISNTPVQWAEGLRNLMLDAGLRDKLRAKAYEAVMDGYTIDKNGYTWENVVEETMGCPRIETLEDTRLPTEALPVAHPV